MVKYSGGFSEGDFWMTLTFKSVDFVKQNTSVVCEWDSFNQLKAIIEQRLASSQKGILPKDGLSA